MHSLPTASEPRARWSTGKNNFDRLLLWLNDPEQAAKDACALDLLSFGFFGTDTAPNQKPAQYIARAFTQGGDIPIEQVIVHKDSSVLPGAWSLVRNATYVLGADPAYYFDNKDLPTASPQAQSLMQFWAIANIMQLAQPIAFLPIADPMAAPEDLVNQLPWSAAIERMAENHANQRIVSLFTGTPLATQPTIQCEASGSGWDEIDPDDLPDEMLVALVEKLKPLELPVPDIGCEYEDPVTHEVGELVFELYWPDQKVAVALLEGEAETNVNGIRVFPFGVTPERLAQAVKAAGNNN